MGDTGSEFPFGQLSKTYRGGISWYRWIHDYRAEQHRRFKAWFEAKDAECPLNCIMELGCGLVVGYADYFRNRQYLGVDLAPHLTEWCRKHRPRDGHRFITKNVLDSDFNETADLVFSQGTVDNVPDMDALLRAAVRASRKLIYITAYRGYFP